MMATGAPIPDISERVRKKQPMGTPALPIAETTERRSQRSIVGTVNSVNLTDGIDGLAGGVTLIVAAFFAAAALLLFGRSGSGSLVGTAVLAAAVA